MPIINLATDSELGDARRRRRLFSGDLFVYGPRATSLAVRDAARRLLEKAMGDQPHLSQQCSSEPEFISAFHAAVTAFAQGSDVMEWICELVADLGCDPSSTFVGGRSLIALTGNGFLPYGTGPGLHPHRDTWRGASPCQVNWWIPVYDLGTSASLAFHPRYWDVPVTNSSPGFDSEAGPSDSYDVEPNIDAVLAQPRALEEIELTPDVRIACPSGGVILSSVAQLHSMVPNPSLGTRFLAHFQTFDVRDLASSSGASNVDARPVGSVLRSFRRCSDWTFLPDDLVDRDLAHRHRDLDLDLDLDDRQPLDWRATATRKDPVLSLSRPLQSV
jgi:hypothetical protein